MPLFGLTGTNLTRALDQLSGEAATGAQRVGFQITDQFLNLVLDPFVDGRSGVGGAALAFTNHWMSTDRFSFAGDHLTAKFNAQSIGGRLEGGYRLGWMFGGITPYAAIQAQSFRTPDYNETDVNGGGFGLGFAGRTATDTRSELGARFDNQMLLYPGAVLALRARVAWAHDWVTDPVLGAVFQTLPGASFIVNGAIPAQNSALAFGRRRTAARQWRLAAWQVRRRVRLALDHIRRHGDDPLSVVSSGGRAAHSSSASRWARFRPVPPRPVAGSTNRTQSWQGHPWPTSGAGLFRRTSDR